MKGLEWVVETPQIPDATADPLVADVLTSVVRPAEALPCVDHCCQEARRSTAKFSAMNASFDDLLVRSVDVDQTCLAMSHCADQMAGLGRSLAVAALGEGAGRSRAAFACGRCLSGFHLSAVDSCQGRSGSQGAELSVETSSKNDSVNHLRSAWEVLGRVDHR